MPRHGLFVLFTCVLLGLLSGGTATANHLDVLFLGDSGHHVPRQRFDQLQPEMAARDIRLVYTDDLADINADNLAMYDVLLLYANIDEITPSAEQAVMDYVNNGGGFVPLHCATFCFRNSPKMVALMGAQFQRHGTGVFRTEIQNNHPLMKSFGGFESWDETYVHHLHNEENRTVLSYRVDENGREPWTWIRTQGNGRVFYTAWGHDHRTWGNPGFVNLVERGVRWAAGDDQTSVPAYLVDAPFPIPEMNTVPADLKPFTYSEVGNKIPNYTPGQSWGTQGQPLSTMQDPLPAEESIKHAVVPKGFHLELFAADPDIQGKPIAMSWDERGRLWIAETYDYPNELQPEGKGRDRIRILEDTDGDWKADKFTVFAEKLSIPTSITFDRGSVIVHDGTRTLRLTDTDGDDKADQREVIFEGWNQGDTHGGVSNFQYGLDNWIWAMQGYNDSRPKNDKIDDDDAVSFRNGFFRFRPDGGEVEFIRSTDNNTWGLGISEEGIIFGSTANHNPSVYMPIANRYYERVRGWTPNLRLGTIAKDHLFSPITDKVRQVDHHGGFTAAAGHALYTARNYPQPWWNRTAFVAGPTGHLLATFVIKPDGSDFHSSNEFNLFASDDEWTAPIMGEVGPDGNVWVIDWYNYIIQHNPTPRGFETGKGNAYKSDLRDKKHGRIYRVVYDDAPDRKPRSLKNADAQTLVKTLADNNMFWRRQAQRLLVERGKDDVQDPLIALVNDTSTDEIGLNPGAIHALWTMHGLGMLDGQHPKATQAALAALKHPSAGVRRNALAVLPNIAESTQAVVDGDLLSDSDAQVRLAALLALSDLPPSTAAGAAILAMSQDKSLVDRWIGDAIVSAAANNAFGFLTAVAGLTSDPGSSVLDSTRVITEHYARGAPVDSIAPLFQALQNAPVDTASWIIDGLAQGWTTEESPEMTDALVSAMDQLLQKAPASSQGNLVKLGRLWGSEHFKKYAAEINATLLAQVQDESLAMNKRIAAATEMVRFGAADDDTLFDLLDCITPQAAPELAGGIMQAIGEHRSPELGEELVDRFDSFTPKLRSQGLAVLLQRPERTRAMLAAIDSGAIQVSELSLDQRQSLLDHPENAIRRSAREILSRGGAVPNADRQAVMESLISVTKATGNVENGMAVFTKNCVNCHLHGKLPGLGKRIGPDLTGMAVHPKAELLTHILDPNRDVEGNYRAYNVIKADGTVLVGLLASESRTAIEIYNSQGEKLPILREDIEALKASTKSLMPEGFEKQITAPELTDLLEFLTERGRFVPVDLRKAATIASDRGMFNSKEGDLERLIFRDWSNKEFEGVPFALIDPQDGKVANTILLYGPAGAMCRTMPRQVNVPCNTATRMIHMLGGVSGWGFPYGEKDSVSMIVKLNYADGESEQIELKNGVHFADYIRRVDVPESKFAFAVRNQQVRYLTVTPTRSEVIESIDFIKGPDGTAPVVIAVTLETL
ncbi:Trehalose utilization [Stieleria varia]|uniref:Trehalose utilization n=2 Tax=Stieleria varia TaxID=2528005 RepID=A0A5C6ASM0_9BACT|nr:Trehalose utilization [Stieleria varia]